jgi:hypothetical protein
MAELTTALARSRQPRYLHWSATMRPEALRPRFAAGLPTTGNANRGQGAPQIVSTRRHRASRRTC